MDIKVGDQVKVVRIVDEYGNPKFLGKVGIVTDISYFADYPLSVSFPGDDPFTDRDIFKAGEITTNIYQPIYPNNYLYWGFQE